MAEWDEIGHKNRTEFPFFHLIEEEVSSRQVVQMAKWLIAEEGLRGRFFFERQNATGYTGIDQPVQFNFSDQTTAMHFKLKYG